MNVPSLSFFVFAAAAAVVINVSENARWRRYVLLVTNFAFILTFTRSPQMLAPFAGLLVLGFAGIKLLERNANRVWFWGFASTILVLFCWLKRYAFIPGFALLPFSYFTIGMSYVFFRVMHLIIDVYQRAVERPVDPLSYVNYCLNFTSLVSGPIQFYHEYRRTESEAPASLTVPIVFSTLERIVLGFFKVAIVSPALSKVQQGVASLLGTPLAFDERVVLAAGLIAIFPMFLYVNFSGYTDVVIGVARWLRLELPENFKHPFSSTGFMEFWTRWHITLSNWLGTYVYSPLLLTLMRKVPSASLQPLLGVLAYFVTFFLVGVWHGQSANVLFLGVMIGLGVSVNKLFQTLMIRRLGRQRYRSVSGSGWFVVASRGFTFSWLGVSLLWLWCSWSEIDKIVSTLGVPAIVGGIVLATVASGVVFTGFVRVSGFLRIASQMAGIGRSPYVRTGLTTALATITLSVTLLLRAPVPTVIYRGF